MSVFTTTRPQTNGAYYSASALYNAGFRGWPLTIMTAIAGNESSWNPFQINNNPSTGDYSVGLTQINYFNGLLQSRTQAYGSPSYLEANPSAQAAATYNLAGGNSLSGLHNWGGGQWTGQPGVSPTFSESGYGPRFAANLPAAAAAASLVSSQGAVSNATLDNQNNWPTGGGASIVPGSSTGPSGALGSGNLPNSGQGTGTGCNTAGPNGDGKVFSEGGIFGIGSFSFTYCQLKALTGGALLVGGGIICLIGIGTIVVSAGLHRTPIVGAAAGFAAGRRGRSSMPEAPSAPEAASQARFRRQSDTINDTANAQARGRATGREAGPFPEAA